MKTQNAYHQIPKISSDIIPLVTTKPKLWLKPTDQMDTWLDSQGYYRKHIARDASSLFRCVSEKVFLTQVHHLTARKHCIQFAVGNPEVFQTLTDTPIHEYVDRLYNQREWGNKLDMEIMSLIYDVDFYMYSDIKKPIEKVTLNGFPCYVMLSLSYEHHYDSVYAKEHIMNAAVCQSIFYEILYKCVFRLEEVDYAVSRMLHDKVARYNADLNMAFFSTGFQMRLEMRDSCRNVKDLLNCGITPFPYKVAKSLDPNIYRNVEYDTWNEQRKGLRHGLISWNNRELQVGSRCVINFKEENDAIKRHGYIQQMSPDKGPVLVFVEELGEKLTVPFESLEVIPASNKRDEKDFPLDASSSEVSQNYKNVEADGKSEIPITKIKEEAKASQPSELCNVHYVHSTPTSVPTTCYACVASQNCLPEPTYSVKSTQVLSHSKDIEDTKITYDVLATNDMNRSNQITSLAVPYQVPVYPVMSTDAPHQPTVVSSMIPPKQSNTGEFADGSAMRLVYSPSVDPYYRYGYTNYPYYVLTPNYVFPTNADPAVQQSTDVSRVNYSPPPYPVSAVTNDLYYGMPVSNVTNKVEVPVYSTQIYYPPYVKKPLKGVNGSPECPSVDSRARPKELMCAKDAASPGSPSPHHSSGGVAANATAYPAVQYPPPPPVYYHHQSYDYYGGNGLGYPEMVQPYENASSVYPAPPHYLPMSYSEEVYPTSPGLVCQPLQPLLPPGHSQ